MYSWYTDPFVSTTLPSGKCETSAVTAISEQLWIFHLCSMLRSTDVASM